MSRVVSMRIRESQIARLRRMARRLGRTLSETGALLVEEGLRRTEFGHIDFRESAAGRQACVQNTSLAVWEIVMVARAHGMDVQKIAKHLEWPVFRVQAALNYAAAYPEEIALAIEDNAAHDFEVISRMLPETERFVAGGRRPRSPAER